MLIVIDSDVEDWMQEVKLPEDEVVSNMKMIVERDRSKLRDDVDTNFDLCDVTQVSEMRRSGRY